MSSTDFEAVSFKQTLVRLAYGVLKEWLLKPMEETEMAILKAEQRGHQVSVNERRALRQTAALEVAERVKKMNQQDRAEAFIHWYETEKGR